MIPSQEFEMCEWKKMVRKIDGYLIHFILWSLKESFNIIQAEGIW